MFEGTRPRIWPSGLGVWAVSPPEALPELEPHAEDVANQNEERRSQDDSKPNKWRYLRSGSCVRIRKSTNGVNEVPGSESRNQEIG
jgi:hypothetical protein